MKPQVSGSHAHSHCSSFTESPLRRCQPAHCSARPGAQQPLAVLEEMSCVGTPAPFLALEVTGKAGRSSQRGTASPLCVSLFVYQAVRDRSAQGTWLWSAFFCSGRCREMSNAECLPSTPNSLVAFSLSCTL